MVQCGLPPSEALWYVRETQRSTMRPTRGPWTAGEIRPQRGLKQGRSCSPMLFRWCVQDVILPLSARGMGAPTNGRVVTHLVCADDTWLMAGSPENLAVMIQELQDAMREKICLLLQPPKSTFARFGPDSQHPPPPSCPRSCAAMHGHKAPCACESSETVQLDLGYDVGWSM